MNRQDAKVAREFILATDGARMDTELTERKRLLLFVFLCELYAKQAFRSQHSALSFICVHLCPICG